MDRMSDRELIAAVTAQVTVIEHRLKEAERNVEEWRKLSIADEKLILAQGDQIHALVLHHAEGVRNFGGMHRDATQRMNEQDEKIRALENHGIELQKIAQVSLNAALEKRVTVGEKDVQRLYNASADQEKRFYAQGDQIHALENRIIELQQIAQKHMLRIMTIEQSSRNIVIAAEQERVKFDKRIASFEGGTKTGRMGPHSGHIKEVDKPYVSTTERKKAVDDNIASKLVEFANKSFGQMSLEELRAERNKYTLRIHEKRKEIAALIELRDECKNHMI